MSNSVRLYGLYIACQVPLPMEFSRQEYWNGLPFSTPEDLPNPGIKPTSLALAVGGAGGERGAGERAGWGPLPLVPPGKPSLVTGKY